MGCVNGQAMLLQPGDRISIRPFEIHFDPKNAKPRPAEGAAESVSALKKQLSELRSKHDELQSQHDEARQQLDAEIAQRQQAAQKQAAQHTELTAAQSRLQQQEQLLAEKNQQIDSIMAAAEPLRKRLADVEVQAQKDASGSVTMIESLRQEIERLREEHSTLQRRMGQAESALQTTELTGQRNVDTIAALDRQLQVLEESARHLEVVQDRVDDAEAG